MPKGYNPYVYADRGEKVVEWGFLDRFGDLVTEPRGHEGKIEHQDLATLVLGMDYREALMDEGYTRLLVSQIDGHDLQAGFGFYAFDTRPLKAIRRYLERTELPITKVDIEALDVDLESRVRGGGFYGSPQKAVAWLRQYKPPEDGEGEEREENPLALPPRAKAWANDSKAQVLVEMDPRDFLVLTTVGDTHRQEIITDAQALGAYNKYVETGESIIPPFLLIELTNGNSDWARVSSHEGRHRAAALINNGESMMPVYIRLRRDYDDPYKLSWKDVPDTILGQFTAGRLNQEGLKLGSRSRVRKSRFKVVEDDRLARFRRENPYEYEPTAKFGLISPDGKVLRARDEDSIHGDIAAREGYSSAIRAMKDGYIKYVIYSDGSAGFEFYGSSKTKLQHLLKFVLSEPSITRSFDIYDYDHSTESMGGESYDADLRLLKSMIRGQENPAPRRPGENPGTTYDVTRFGFLRPGQAPIVKGDFDRGKWNHHRIAQKYGFSDHRAAVDSGWIRFEHLHHWRGLPEGVDHYAGYLFRKDQESIEAVANHLRRSGAFDRIVLDTRAQGVDLDSREFRNNGEALRYLESLKQNPAPKRPGDKDLRWPFKLIQQSDSVLVAEMNDLSRFNVVHHADGTWRWAPANTSRWSETFSTLEGALLNLETEAESHTGRLGGTMKFIIYSPTSRILGTVTAPNRRAARDVMRGSLKALRFKTAQDGFLQPYISSGPEAKYVADQGVQIK